MYTNLLIQILQFLSDRVFRRKKRYQKTINHGNQGTFILRLACVEARSKKWKESLLFWLGNVKANWLSRSGLTSLFRSSLVLRFTLSVLLPFYSRLFAAARRDRSDYYAVTFHAGRYSWSIVVTGSSSRLVSRPKYLYSQWLFFNVIHHL